MSSSVPINKDDPKVGGKDVWVEDREGDASLDVMAVYNSYEPEFRRDVELRLRRKIDTRILPLVVIIYLFNYLDRNSITQARLYGLQEDTGVKGAQYQTAISIFSAGYILMQLPSTILMTKLRPSIYLVNSSPFQFPLINANGSFSQHASLFGLSLVDAPPPFTTPLVY
jgi:hypothetical protein